MTVFVILLVWLLLACFNIFKIKQSTIGARDVFEPLLAIIFAPLYFITALVVIFGIKKWN